MGPGCTHLCGEPAHGEQDVAQISDADRAYQNQVPFCYTDRNSQEKRSK